MSTDSQRQVKIYLIVCKIYLLKKILTQHRIHLQKRQLDFNTLGKIEDELKNNQFIFDKDNYEFIYSPNHLEEVYRMQIDDYRDARIHSITVLTNNNLILPLHKKLSFYTEDPNYSYRRVTSNLRISELVEESILYWGILILKLNALSRLATEVKLSGTNQYNFLPFLSVPT